MNIGRDFNMEWRVRVILPLILIWFAMGQAASAEKQAAADQWLARPVNSRTFQTFLDFFTYDGGVLVSGSVDDPGAGPDALAGRARDGLRLGHRRDQRERPQRQRSGSELQLRRSRLRDLEHLQRERGAPHGHRERKQDC